ncbi:hypothetical protein [Bacillus sp. FJAT-27245]|uniref:hypothetical protein n=1 Tax=Bacillus sp. FJAT-27245 TaxID=1684144 RepID=UPI0006A7ECB3|nr:hypothetical protein [Bacillus sp. FJAT-27245]
MLKRFLVFIACLVVGIFFVTLGSSVSYACKCDGLPPVEEELEKSTTVFTGKVIGVNEEKGTGIDSPTIKVLFEVSDTWKGISESQIILQFNQSSCNIDFKKGKEYLIYAKENPDFKKKTAMTTGVCDRSAEVTKAGGDLTFLGRGEAPVKQVSLRKELDPPVPVRTILMWMPVVGVAGLVGFFVWKGAKK